MKRNLRNYMVMVFKSELKGNITDTMAAITLGFNEEKKEVTYILYYLEEQNKIQDEEIINDVSAEVNAHVWQDIEKIIIDCVYYKPGIALKKLDDWLYIKENLLNLIEEK